MANAMSVLARATAAPDDSSGAHAGGEHKHWHLHRKHNPPPSACRVTQQDLAKCKVRSCAMVSTKELAFSLDTAGGADPVCTGRRPGGLG